jgi:putative transposase
MITLVGAALRRPSPHHIPGGHRGGVNPPLQYQSEATALRSAICSPMLHPVMPQHRRKQHHLAPQSYLGRHLYFATICTKDRAPLFGNASLVSACLDVLRDATVAQGFGVYAYCFMPDHLHLVLVGFNDSASLSEIIRSFKGHSTAAARKLGVRNLWQKGYYDHIIRDGRSLDAVARYVFENPVRAGLVLDPFDWPFSGSLLMDWKRLEAPPEPFRPPWKNRGAG